MSVVLAVITVVTTVGAIATVAFICVAVGRMVRHALYGPWPDESESGEPKLPPSPLSGVGPSNVRDSRW